MGLLFDIPGIGVLKRTLTLLATSQRGGMPWPSPTPDALGPRNCGQGRAAPRGAFWSRAGPTAVLSGAGSAVEMPKPAISPSRFTVRNSMVPARPPNRASASPDADSNRPSAIGFSTSSGCEPIAITSAPSRTVTLASLGPPR